MWVGLVLLGVALLTLAAGGIAVMGDPFPVSRVGVSSHSDGFLIVNAVCPGERVREITLRRQTESGPYDELWRISGDAVLPERLPLGSLPSGMRTVTPLSERPGDRDRLSLTVVTNELEGPYSMEFTAAEVPSSGVLSFDVRYPTAASFERARFSDTPCGDPYAKKGAERFLLIAMVVSVGLGAAGAVLLLMARHHRRRVG